MAYDWILIKSEYIQGCTDDNGERICPTLDQLSERHGCSLSTLLKRSAREKWNTERNMYSIKRNKKIFEKKEEILISEASNFDNKSLNVAELGVEEGLKRLSAKDLSNHDFQKISTAVSNFVKIGKLALGEPTEHLQSDNKQDVTLYDKADTGADIADLYERWDEKTDKSSGSGKG